MQRYHSQHDSRRLSHAERSEAARATFTLQPSPFNPRSGFTLVELLVAMGIFVILATLTVGALRTNNADRVGNSVGTIRNALEGSRSRAISSSEPRGLRLLTDPNDGRIVTSMIYVGANGYNEGTLDITAINSSSITVTNNAGGEWGTLASRDILEVGNRIKIGDRWMTITGLAGNNATLAGTYYTSQSIPVNDVEFELELSPSVLEGAEPILLSPGTCIDLDGSDVPPRWRAAFAAPTDRYDPRMDIMFAPSGVVTGELATTGILHLRVAYISDVILASTVTGRPLTGSPAIGVVPADPEKDHRAVSLFPNTGNIVRAEINPAGDNNDGTFNNSAATNPFQFAIEGKESK